MNKKPTYDELEQRVRELESSESAYKKTIATLQKNEKSYRNLFENMLHEVHIWELIYDAFGEIKTWKLVDANPTALKAWGKSLSAISGKTTDEIFPNSNATELFMPVVKDIFKENKPKIWESYFPATNQYLHMVSIPFGKSFISTGLDITDLRKSEMEKHDLQEQYRSIVENISDFIMRYDSELRHIYANPPAIKVTGLSADQYIGKTHRQMGFPEELCQLWENNIQFVFNEGKTKIVEFDVELADGLMSLELQLNPEFGLDGSVKSVVGISRDVTRRKAAEKKLESERALLSAVFDNIEEAIVICDEKGNLTRFNEAARRLHGLPEMPIPPDQWAEHYDLYNEDKITPYRWKVFRCTGP